MQFLNSCKCFNALSHFIFFSFIESTNEELKKELEKGISSKQRKTTNSLKHILNGSNSKASSIKKRQKTSNNLISNQKPSKETVPTSPSGNDPSNPKPSKETVPKSPSGNDPHTVGHKKITQKKYLGAKELLTRKGVVNLEQVYESISNNEVKLFFGTQKLQHHLSKIMKGSQPSRRHELSKEFITAEITPSKNPLVPLANCTFLKDENNILTQLRNICIPMYRTAFPSEKEEEIINNYANYVLVPEGIIYYLHSNHKMTLKDAETFFKDACNTEDVEGCWYEDLCAAQKQVSEQQSTEKTVPVVEAQSSMAPDLVEGYQSTHENMDEVSRPPLVEAQIAVIPDLVQGQQSSDDEDITDFTNNKPHNSDEGNAEVLIYVMHLLQYIMIHIHLFISSIYYSK